MVRPTIRTPSRESSPATTELSTPPDMATAIVSFIGSGTGGISRRKLSQMRGTFGDGVNQSVHLFFGVRTAEGETQTGARPFPRQAHGQQYMRRFNRAARAGRSAGHREPLEVQRDDQG